MTDLSYVLVMVGGARFAPGSVRLFSVRCRVSTCRGSSVAVSQIITRAWGFDLPAHLVG